MVAASRKRARRTYDNSLRVEHAEQTRQRIIDAAVALITETKGQLTIAQLAERAGVSEPTIYRHFGSREGLYEALDVSLARQFGLPQFPNTVSELPEQVKTLFRKFDEHTDLLRAATLVGLARDVRERAKTKRAGRIQEIMAAETEHLPRAEAAAVAAFFRLIVGWDSWQRLVHELGITSERAAEVTAWALTALTDKLRQDRAEGRTSLNAEQNKGGDKK